MLALIELLVFLGLPAVVALVVLRQRRTTAPGEVLLVCGRRGLSDRGYAFVRGTTFVVPFVEAAETLSLEPTELRFERRLRTSTGEEIDVEIVARIAYPERAERLIEAVELLPSAPEARDQLAIDAIAGAAAHVIAGSSVAELRAGLGNVTDAVLSRATLGLSALGLELYALSLNPRPGALLRA